MRGVGVCLLVWAATLFGAFSSGGAQLVFEDSCNSIPQYTVRAHAMPPLH
jgi:hypothetical protein|eukprot:COSAG01_NODE_2505_length_7553_cov_11.744030_12_plen_50_part_00